MNNSIEANSGCKCDISCSSEDCSDENSLNYDLSDNETGVQPSKIEDSSDDTEGTFVDLVRTTAEQKNSLCVTEKDQAKQTISLNAYLIKQ